jgi:hypothetical protein
MTVHGTHPPPEGPFWGVSLAEGISFLGGEAGSSLMPFAWQSIVHSSMLSHELRGGVVQVGVLENTEPRALSVTL